MENILNTIKTWQLEAFSANNDGWTQNGYREQLIEIRDYLNNIWYGHTSSLLTRKFVNEVILMENWVDK